MFTYVLIMSELHFLMWTFISKLVVTSPHICLRCMHCTSHLRHWQWTCLWSDVQCGTLLKHVALWHLHWFYNLNIVILYVNVAWKMGDTSSHLVLWCERCISHLIHCNCSCSRFDINFRKMTQTYYVLTFAFAFMMQTLWNRL